MGSAWTRVFRIGSDGVLGTRAPVGETVLVDTLLHGNILIRTQIGELMHAFAGCVRRCAATYHSYDG
jgi:hypothetical protein